MNLLLFCVYIGLVSSCTEKFVSEDTKVLCCHEKMMYIEDDTIVYESEQLKYPCDLEPVGGGVSGWLWVALFCCLCGVTSLLCFLYKCLPEFVYNYWHLLL